jgi:DNA-binding MarR family transcriptional regulator
VEEHETTCIYVTHIRPYQSHLTYKPGRTIMMVTETLVRKLEGFINQIRMLDDGMPVQTLACFLAIARREGRSIAEIAQEVGIAPSSASRNVSALAVWNWQKKPGLDIVETRVDPMELRKKQVFLNSKGRRLLAQIESIFADGGRP